MSLIVVKVDVILPQEEICAQSEGNPLMDTFHKIKVKTTPTGFEKDVELSVKEVTPDNADNNGTLDRRDDYNWGYWALLEDQSDKWPGYDDMDKRYWDISFKYNILGNERDVNEKLKVFSVFKYLVDHNLQSVAIEYVVWKYNLSGCTIGSYSPDLTDAYGKTDLNTCAVSYGQLAFLSENILASTIIHENEHVKQPWIVRFRGAEDDLAYRHISVNGTTIPEPPARPTVKPFFGLDWATMELPAYDAEKGNVANTGADDNNNDFYGTMLDWYDFFGYIIQINNN